MKALEINTKIKNFDDFKKCIEANPEGVVLLEGKRDIPPEWAVRAEAVGAFLAKTFPKLLFRSGNAAGADEAFSKGVASVDVSRLHVIMPFEGHRQKSQIAGAAYDSPKAYTAEQEEEIFRRSVIASPNRKDYLARRHMPKGIGANYLMRDTMKVVGHPEKFSPAICGLFYVDPADPLGGGTGHTIRVCLDAEVPAFTQAVWGEWVDVS